MISEAFGVTVEMHLYSVESHLVKLVPACLAKSADLLRRGRRDHIKLRILEVNHADVFHGVFDALVTQLYLSFHSFRLNFYVHNTCGCQKLLYAKWCATSTSTSTLKKRSFTAKSMRTEVSSSSFFYSYYSVLKFSRFSTTP